MKEKESKRVITLRLVDNRQGVLFSLTYTRIFTLTHTPLSLYILNFYFQMCLHVHIPLFGIL